MSRVNDVGSWEIKLPDTVIDERGQTVKHLAAKHLRQQGAGLIITGPDGVIISGPMASATFEASDKDLPGTWTFKGESDLVLLADALAYPSPEVFDPGAQTASNDVRTDDAESLIRAYVANNLVAGNAHPDRVVGDRAFLRLEATNQHRGVVLTKSPRFQKLLELAREIAGAAGLCFDVVQEGDVLRLRVWTPADRSKLVRLDMANDLVESTSYGLAVPKTTYAIVAGQGEGTDRTIFGISSTDAVSAETRWGRRIERFIDQRQTDDEAELRQKAEATLAAALATSTGLTATPSDTDTMRFGTDWANGDTVSVVVEGQEVPASVTEVALGIDKARVTLVATLGGMDSFDAETAADSRGRTTESRVSALERTAESVKNLQLVDLGGNLPAARVTGLPKSSGTTAERDAYFGTPSTDPERAELANRRVEWFNTELGWTESYYAVHGTAGLTVRGLMTGGPPPGWYPLGPGGPTMRLQGNGGKAANNYAEYDVWRSPTRTAVGNGDGFDPVRSYAGFTQPTASAMSPDLWGLYHVSAEMYLPNGTGTGIVGFACFRPSTNAYAWDLQQAVPLLPNNGQPKQWAARSILLRPADRLFLRSVNGQWTVGGGNTFIAAEYAAPPLVNL